MSDSAMDREYHRCKYVGEAPDGGGVCQGEESTLESEWSGLASMRET